jgi:hypothetical protein
LELGSLVGKMSYSFGNNQGANTWLTPTQLGRLCWERKSSILNPFRSGRNLSRGNNLILKL